MEGLIERGAYLKFWFRGEGLIREGGLIEFLRQIIDKSFACGHSECADIKYQYVATSSVRKQKFALESQQNDLKFNY